MTEIETVILAVTALTSCLFCIYAVFFFGRRLHADVYGRDVIVEGVKKQIEQGLVADLNNRIYYEPISNDLNPLPAEAGEYGCAFFWDNRDHVLGTPDVFVPTPGMKATEVEGAKAYWQKLKALKKWAQVELSLYEKEKKKIGADAKKKAEERVPKSVDVPLLGSGFTFLLEFSTVIVIIFALIILGIVGTLEGREIATILAAIAGYVLGKSGRATQSKKTSEE